MKLKNLEIGLLLAVLFVNMFILIYIFQPSLAGRIISPIQENSIKSSPSDFIKESNIVAENNQINIFIENFTLSRYNSSKSMFPLISNSSTGINKIPSSEKEINIGDIISFKSNNRIIVHRVIEKGYDKKGVYFITKGDNNTFRDEKIRFSQIRSVLVAIIY